MKWELPAVLVVMMVSGLFLMSGLAAASDGQDDQTSEGAIMQQWDRAAIVPLSGAQVMPQPVEIDASGIALFWPGENLESIYYVVFVSNLTDVNQAQIQMREGNSTTGSPVVWLYPEENMTAEIKPGVTTGILAAGRFTAEDLVGPMANMTMGDLFDEMDNGTLYINVHTNEHPSGAISGEMSTNKSLGMLFGIFGNMTAPWTNAIPWSGIVGY